MTQDEISIAWAAGLFEGEGSVGIKTYAVRASIQMTDLDVLEKIQNFFGGNIYVARKQKEHHKQSWVWAITKSSDSIEFLKTIYPYLGRRRSERVKEVLAIASNDRAAQKAVRYNQIKLMIAEGLTHQQIADKLGIKRSKVRYTINTSK